MNDRIFDLAKQARYDSRNEKHYLERVHNREITLDEYYEIYDKKFAELILTEVIDILTSYRGKVIFVDGFEYNCEHPIVAISKHFGIDK